MTHLVVKFTYTQCDAKTLQYSHCALEQFSLIEYHLLQLFQQKLELSSSSCSYLKLPTQITMPFIHTS